jgi:DNA-binding protein WhiA
MKAELAAVLRNNSVIGVNEGNYYIKVITENAAFARRVFSIIKNVYNINPEVIIKRNIKLKKHVTYVIIINKANKKSKLLKDIGFNLNTFKLKIKSNVSGVHSIIGKRNCCRKAYLRGAFLSGGSVSDPEKTYHMELPSSKLYIADELQKVMGYFNLNCKMIKRKSYYVIYIKEGENIVDFINVIGAHKSLLEIENIRIVKEMRNNVNRVVNCETANMDKTINASIRQINNINYIIENKEWENLPSGLQEAARLRLLNKESNLAELGKLFSPPLGKSGVNHRLLKLEEIADEIKRRKGDL